jgi:hypothetical protein
MRRKERNWNMYLLIAAVLGSVIFIAWFFIYMPLAPRY